MYRAGSAPSANPVNGVAYQVGDPIGGGTVIRKTSSAGSRAFEHTGLAQGTTHYYVFYAANHSYYSPALAPHRRHHELQIVARRWIRCPTPTALTWPPGRRHR